MNYSTKTRKYKDTKGTADLNLIGEPLLYRRDPMAHIEKQVKNLDLELEDIPKSIEEQIVDTLESLSSKNNKNFKNEFKEALDFIASGKQLPEKENEISKEKREHLLTIFSNLVWGKNVIRKKPYNISYKT